MNTNQNQNDHEDPVHRLLDQATPEAPSTVEWAGRAARRATTRRNGWVVAAVVAVLAVPGYLVTTRELPRTATPPPAASSSPSSTQPTSRQPSTASSTPSGSSSLPPATAQRGEVTASLKLWQGPKQAMPMLCFSMLSTHPPKCSGPVLVDPSFSWDNVPHNEVEGVFWSSTEVTVVGRLDLMKGTTGTFTLTRPLNSTPAPTPSPEPEQDLTPLCTDPGRGQDSTKVTAEDEPARDAVLEGLPVITSWQGSDQAGSFNVLVRGDAEQARRAIRAVWGGPLCVATGTGPTRTERDAVIQRFMELPRSVGYAGVSDRGRDGTLHVILFQPDPAAEAKVRAAAGKGMRVKFSYAYQAFAG